MRRDPYQVLSFFYTLVSRLTEASGAPLKDSAICAVKGVEKAAFTPVYLESTPVSDAITGCGGAIMPCSPFTGPTETAAVCGYIVGRGETQPGFWEQYSTNSSTTLVDCVNSAFDCVPVTTEAMDEQFKKFLLGLGITGGVLFLCVCAALCTGWLSKRSSIQASASGAPPARGEPPLGIGDLYDVLLVEEEEREDAAGAAARNDGSGSIASALGALGLAATPSSTQVGAGAGGASSTASDENAVSILGAARGAA